MAKGYSKNGKPNKGWIKKGEHKSIDTEIKKGVRFSPKTEFKKGNVGYWQGKKRPPLSKEWKGKIRKTMTGRHRPEKVRQKLSKAFKGEKSHFWKGGINDINNTIRKSARYKRWREKVFKRDNYTCQECGQKGGYLEPHHIKSFAEYPKLRFKVSNGRTLCRECHKKITKKRLCQNQERS